jgi:hypothetical protein
VAFCPFGTKRTRSLDCNSSEELLLTLPKSIQVVPSSEYCQCPLPSVVPVMAMPCTAPVSTSAMLAPASAATVVPPLVVWSSVIPVSVGDAGAKFGASFTGVTSTVVVCAAPATCRLSFTTQLIVRVVSGPKFVGLSLLLL